MTSKPTSNIPFGQACCVDPETMPTINAKMAQEVKTQLAGLASYETPKKVALLEHDFSVERGELTPTLKVKRRVIDKTYKPLIDGLYGE